MWWMGRNRSKCDQLPLSSPDSEKTCDAARIEARRLHRPRPTPPAVHRRAAAPDARSAACRPGTPEPGTPDAGTTGPGTAGAGTTGTASTGTGTTGTGTTGTGSPGTGSTGTGTTGTGPTGAGGTGTCTAVRPGRRRGRDPRARCDPA